MGSLRQRIWRLGWGLALLVCLISASAEAQGPKPKNYALLIGINEYLNGGIQGVNPLSFAVKDAEALEAVLKERGWHTRAIVKEDVKRERIVRELYDLALKAKLHDKVLIYFAGHGVRDPISGGHTYWLTYDAEIGSLVAKGIRLKHIMEYVKEIPAQEKIVLLDHCYSGDIKAVPAPQPQPGDDPAGGEESRAPGRTELDTETATRALYPPDLESLKKSKEDRLVVLAAARGPAYESATWGHGMFTKAILDVLGDPATDTSDPKDGKISLNEFWTKVSGAVKSMAGVKGLAQEPFGSEITLNQLEWSLFDAVVDAGNEAEDLRNLVTALDLAAALDFEVKMACLELLAAWELREQNGLDQDEKHERIVNELRNMRDRGLGGHEDTFKASLEGLVRGLGLA